MINKPLVSVVMPAYNHENFIKEAIESVLCQTYKNREIIIIDDGSTDKTPEIINNYANKYINEIRYYRQVNMGAHNAINNGIDKAKGDYISIINSDDIYTNDRIETLLDSLQTSDSSLAFSDVEFIDDTGNILNEQNDFVREIRKKINSLHNYPTLGYALLHSNIAVSTGNFLFTKKLYVFVGGFKRYKYCHDWAFILNSLKFTIPIFIKKKLYNYRVHKGNTFSKLEHLADQETNSILRDFLNFSVRLTVAPNSNFPCPANHTKDFDSYIKSFGYQFINQQ